MGDVWLTYCCNCGCLELCRARVRADHHRRMVKYKGPASAFTQARHGGPKTTALLVMDLIKQACNEQNRPRCIASLPKIAKLLAEAREKGVKVIYTTFPSPAPNIPAPVIGDTLPAVAPKGNEPVVVSFVDKFILRDKDTGLEKMLKDKGITTVIAVGTAVHGAVLYTSSAASLRGFNY